MTHDLDRIVAALAPDPGPGLVPGAHDLMREIMDTSPEPTVQPAVASSGRRGRMGWRIAVPAVAVLAASVTVLGWTSALPVFGPEPVGAALVITQEDGYYVIQVKDLRADPPKYQEQLKALGLDVSLRLIPATPGLVGNLLATAPSGDVIQEFKTIDRPGPCDKLGSCPIGLKIPVGYKGTALVELGREAEPGEKYFSSTAFDAKGEPMHCVPYVNKKVGEVRTILAERGLSIMGFATGNSPETIKEVATVPDSWYVTAGFLVMPGQATLFAGPEPKADHLVKMRWKKQGCS
ncbi:hypothetical protein [Nonomuraea africana]|uniref:Uncharacterized protein n=1 Tax=Nonomuraea africana TaxID=46171 RepID=A0ABR9KLV8_9ACTN|nr:hypothetical protein [Nonomuraea africana]MBE1562603.1 hypothetical protein [Nonomuraea africana]